LTPDLTNRLRAEMNLLDPEAGRRRAITEAYKGAGGEAEARAVQARADLDPQTLRNCFPSQDYDWNGSAANLWDPKTGSSLPGW
jgi:hypothetical protein